MDVFINLLIGAHILAFVAGGSNSVVGPVIAGRIAGATPEMRTGYYGVMNTLAQVGKVAMVVLLVSGPLILWLRYGGLGGASIWFWIKMALIVVMLATIIYGGINDKKAQAGDGAAAERADIAHKITSVAFLGVVLAAVFAFS
jgi:putative membrane protein